MQKASKTLHAEICSYIAKDGRNISSSRMTTPFLKLFSVPSCLSNIDNRWLDKAPRLKVIWTSSSDSICE